jgi:hypothetical protein
MVSGNSGRAQPWKEAERYSKRKQDRLDHPLLLRYLGSFGIAADSQFVLRSGLCDPTTRNLSISSRIRRRIPGETWRCSRVTADPPSAPAERQPLVSLVSTQLKLTEAGTTS